MANKRTYINADEELVIQGKLTIEGNIEQRDTIVVTETTVLDSDQFIINNDQTDTVAKIIMNSGTSNATLSYDNSTSNLTVTAGNIVIDGALSVGGNIVGSISNADYATSAGNLFVTRNFSISGDGTAPAVGFNGDMNVPLVFTLSNTAVTAGDYGTEAIVPVLTIDEKGRITNASNTAISITSDNITDFVTAVRSNVNSSTGLDYNVSTGVFNISATSVTTGTYGSASDVGIFTVNQQGQLTNAVTTSITITSDQVSDFIANANLAIEEYISANANLTFGSGVISHALTTDDISEGTNLFYTTPRSNTDVEAYLSANANLTFGNGVISHNLTSDDIAEGDATFYTDARARASISVTDTGGDGSLSYSNANGVITYVGPDATEVRAHFSGGDGIDLSLGVIDVDNTVVRTSGTQSIADTKTFTGTVDLTSATATASTQANTDNSNNIATTAYVTTAINDLVDGANLDLDTLNEIAESLGNNDNIIGIINNNASNVSDLQSRSITAGNGLVGGGDLTADRTFNIGASTGITVNADNIEVDLSPFSTTDLSEGTNLYYTDARFDTRLASKDTADLSEGSNLYYTTDRANSAIEAYLSAGTGIDYGSGTIALENTAVSAGSYGDADSTISLTVDAQGRITAASEQDIAITASQVTDFTTSANTVVENYLVGGDGIDFASATIDVDATVIRTTGDQSLANVKTFTGGLIVPHVTSTANGSIYYNGTDFWGIVNGQALKLTPSSDVGEVEDVGATGVDIYAGARMVMSGNANVNYHGIKSLDNDQYIDITDASNVITVGANTTAVTTLIRDSVSVTDVGGDGSLSYSNTTGIFTYTGPSATEVRAHFSAGSGITITDGVIASNNDNYNSWVIETDSGSGSSETVTANERVTIQGGTNITVENTGNVITIRNDNVADIESVTAGNGLTGGGNNGNVTLNVGAGTGVTVSADDISIGQDVSNTANVEFNAVKFRTDSNLTHQEGCVFYDNDNKALAVYNDVTDITLQIGQEEWLRVFNNSGANITNGKPVYITGESNGLPTIDLASANAEASSYVVGLATHDIQDSSIGYVTTRGIVRDLDTSGLTAGERAHVGVTAGTLQTLAPTYPYFPSDIGFVLTSNASVGLIYVDVQSHVAETLRITDAARVDGDMTVAGNLTILGPQSVVSVSSLAVDSPFIYTGSGDTIGDAGTTFSGSGLDDGTLKGGYEGTQTNKTFYVRIDGVGTGTGNVDTFEWSLDNFSSTEATTVDITGAEQDLEDGITIKFDATTGHTSGDTWSGNASPVNVDSGLVGNRNTGNTGVGYTHIGMFFDVSDEKFKFFDEYAPEPTGDIDTSNSTFSLGTVVAEEFEGNITGDVTGDVTGTVTGTVSSLSNHDTGDLSEGTNLYFTTQRARDTLSGGTGITYSNTTGQISLTDSAFVSGVTAGNGLTGGGTSGNVTVNAVGGYGITVNADNIETNNANIRALFSGTGDVLYNASTGAFSVTTYKTTDFDTDFTGKDTDDLSEGSSNLYYTVARANTAIDNRVTQSFVNSLGIDADKLDNEEGSYYLDASNMNAGTLPSARLPELVIGDFEANTITTSAESFVDNDTTLMTSAAIADKIESYGYITSQTDSQTLSWAGASGQLTISGGNTVDLDGRYSQTDTTYSGGTDLTLVGTTFNVDSATSATANKIAKRDSSGNLTANLFNGTATSARYADLAEKYATDTNYEAGTVVVFGGEAEVTVTSKMENTSVAGVISTDPAYMMNSEADGQYVALRGRVPCKVIGPVRKGDVLVTSTTAGYAQVSSNPHMVPAACIIGKAVADHAGEGQGIVEIVV